MKKYLILPLIFGLFSLCTFSMNEESIYIEDNKDLIREVMLEMNKYQNQILEETKTLIKDNEQSTNYGKYNLYFLTYFPVTINLLAFIFMMQIIDNIKDTGEILCIGMFLGAVAVINKIMLTNAKNLTKEINQEILALNIASDLNNLFKEFFKKDENDRYTHINSYFKDIQKHGTQLSKNLLKIS